MVLKEQQQLSKIRHGDLKSFENLFHRFHNGLCGYALTLVGIEEVAEEVVQDVFYNIWKNRETLKITRNLQSYLYRSVYNNSMMVLCKKRREYAMDEQKMLDRQIDSSDPSQIMQLNEVTELVTRTLEGLSDRTREIFLLNRQEGMKYSEIAERLSISVKTVEANMGKALKALRNSLEKYEQE